MGLQTAAQTTWQAGSRGASDAFNRFVEGGEGHPGQRNFDNGNLAYGEEEYRGDPDKKDFWDSFAAAGESRMAEKQRKPKVEPERKDFWDEFASIGESKTKTAQAGGMFGALGAGSQSAQKGKSSIGTAAMSKRAPSGPSGKAGDEWEDW